jgi:hypothetical protein
MIKRLTFVRRGDGVASDDFAARWRDEALRCHESGPQRAREQRLVHCVVRPGRAERPYHGVAIAWFDDEAALAARDQHGARTTGETLTDRSATVRALVEERTVFGQDLLHAWWRDQTAGPRLLLLAFIQRQPHLSRTQFRDYWWEHHRPLANEMLPPALQPPIYVHNYALPDEPCPWDGLGEFYDTSVDVARQRARSTEGLVAEAIVADEEKFLVRDTRSVLITDAEVVVSDA